MKKSTSDQCCQNLVKFALTESEFEIGYGECIDLLDQYADAINSGADLDALMLKIEHRLQKCPMTAEEFRALMVMIQQQEAEV